MTKSFLSKCSLRTAVLVAGLAGLVAIFHIEGTSVYEEWAHGSLFIWLHCIWKFDSIGAVNYTFSYLVPLVAIWFVWRERDTLRRSQWQDSWKGLIVLTCMFLIHGIALRGQLPHLSAITFIGALWALPTALGGRPVGRALAFPACYLLLAVPLGFIERATFPLRHAASAISAAVLNGLNLPVTRIGTAIHSASGSFSLDVADPCSGIRSMLALLALGAAFARLARLTSLGKILLFASSIPVALIGNVVRIVLLALAAEFWGVELALGAYHDVSAYIVFAVAVLLLPLVERLLKKGFKTESRDVTPASQPDTSCLPVHRGFAIALVCIFVAALPYARKMLTISTLTTAPIDMHLPERVGDWTGERIFYSSDASVTRSFRQSELADPHTCPETGAALTSASLAERVGLPGDTEIIKAVYGRPGTDDIFVSLVRSGETRGSIHKPQWCIAAQGFSVLSTSFPTLRKEGDKRVALLRISPGEQRRQSFFCYWFIGQNHSTPYHTSRVLRMAVDRLIKGHATRWAYISITAPASETMEKRLPEFVQELENALLNHAINQ
jgi:exosortase